MSMYTCIPNEYTPYTFPPLAAMSMGFSRMSMIFQDVYANRTHHFCFRTHWLSRPGVFAEYGWHTHRKNALRRVRTFFTEAYSSIPVWWSYLEAPPHPSPLLPPPRDYEKGHNRSPTHSFHTYFPPQCNFKKSHSKITLQVVNLCQDIKTDY